MKSVPGNQIELVEVAYAPHNIFLGGLILEFEEQAREAADCAQDFLNRQMSPQ